MAVFHWQLTRQWLGQNPYHKNPLYCQLNTYPALKQYGLLLLRFLLATTVIRVEERNF